MPNLQISEDNKRTSFRCPIPELRKVTMTKDLPCESVEYEAFVFDESAGGYGVFVPKSMKLDLDDRVILESNDKKTVCELTRKQRFTPEEMAMGVSVQDFQKVGLKLIAEIHEEPEKKNARDVGRPSYFVSSTYAWPMLIACVVLISAIGGFIYYETTKEYRDEFGRPHKGTASTAFWKFYNSVLGDPGNEDGRKGSRKKPVKKTAANQ